jgi:hypothetical protein
MKDRDKIALLVGFLIIVIIISRSSGTDDGPAELLREEAYRPTGIDAYVMAKQLIEPQLKAPKTAEFASYSESKVTLVGNDKWEVISYVDSQNSFGALIRTRFKITMTVNRETKYWQAVDLETSP